MEKRIVEIPKFKDHFEKMLISSVRSEFSNLINDDLFKSKIDWDYLLLCASIIALSPEDKYQAMALRIASSCITATDVKYNHRVAAAIVLNRISNTPSIELAMHKKIIPQDALTKLPISLLLDRIKSDFRQTILNNRGEVLFLNQFQREIYEQVNSSKWLSISAPTSAGKSFILEFLVEEYIAKNPTKNVCFLVPTRALISQVEGDLIEKLTKSKLGRVHLSSVPQLPRQWQEKQLLMVLTQERLSWLMNEAPQDFSFGLIVVDEAQKIGDGHRGIVLQQVLQTICLRSPNTRIVFSSPLTANPEILFRLKPPQVEAENATSDYVAVNQNMIWVEQVPRKKKEWKLHLFAEEHEKNIGDFISREDPPDGSLRLPFIAKSIGGDSGVLIYANTPSDAEKFALYLYNAINDPIKHSTYLRKLISQTKSTVHREYILAKVLGKGIAFHYGNMPTSLRVEIEKQFKLGRIKYLICTSTLIEGVNLGARSIFIRSPKKGRSRKMNLIDFWNLAGRAGRLGSDFQGNIVCVDVSKKDVWDFIPPKKRNKSEIKESSDISGETLIALITYIKDGTPRSTGDKENFLEYLLSFFLIQWQRSGEIFIPSLDENKKYLIKELEDALSAMMSSVSVPSQIIERNIGVSPLAQESLLQYFRAYNKDPRNLIPINPAERDSVKKSYVKMLSRIFTHLSGHNNAIVFPMSILVVSWIRGYSLNSIIKRNWKYWRPKGKTLPNVIRESMEDIEDFVRFRFAKYSTCYLEILRHHFATSNKSDLLSEIPNLSMWLEFGSSQETQISLMSLGLSRAAAISFSGVLGKDGLNREQCAELILTSSISRLKLPRNVREELEHIKELLMQN